MSYFVNGEIYFRRLTDAMAYAEAKRQDIWIHDACGHYRVTDFNGKVIWERK